MIIIQVSAKEPYFFSFFFFFTHLYYSTKRLISGLALKVIPSGAQGTFYDAEDMKQGLLRIGKHLNLNTMYPAPIFFFDWEEVSYNLLCSVVLSSKIGRCREWGFLFLLLPISSRSVAFLCLQFFCCLILLPSDLYICC